MYHKGYVAGPLTTTLGDIRVRPQTRFDYPRYRELGMKLGSGRAEGACKSLVAAHCKQAGMRNWTRSGAQGVLRLRAAFQSGDLNSLRPHHPQSTA